MSGINKYAKAQADVHDPLIENIECITGDNDCNKQQSVLISYLVFHNYWPKPGTLRNTCVLETVIILSQRRGPKL